MALQTPFGEKEHFGNHMLHPAKITAPCISGIIPRKRIFSLLDNYFQKPVVWITSPAGSGKTSLMASYLKAR